MATYGLLSSGLLIPSFEEWQQEYFDLASAAWGSEANVTTDSVIGQILIIPCYQDIKIWQALESVYSSQTLDGAEGIYLDEVTSRRGVFRNSASAGTGYPYINTDATGLWTDTIPTTTYFSATNGYNYQVTTETALRDRITAYNVTRSEVLTATSSITYYINNITTGEIVSQVFTPALSSFLDDLVTFIQDNIATADQSLVFVDSSTNTLYMGYTQNSSTDISLTGLGTSVEFYASTNVGRKWSLIPVQCQTTGKYTVGVNNITGMSPTPTGYISVGNLTSFSPGSEVETDAELRVRFNNTSDEATGSTRPAILKAVSDLTDVQAVRIYDNPTASDTTEAPAYTFNTVVLGGTISDIASTIYTKKPINSLTYGTTSYTVPTEDGGTEAINFTVCEEVAYGLKISYKKADGSSLTSTQKSDIGSAFDTFAESFIIGTEIFNDQLKSVVYKTLDFGVLTYLSISSKITSAPDTAYSTDDISPTFSELITMSSDDITFSQVV